MAKPWKRTPRAAYASAAEFAKDIHHYLRDEPIAARPPPTFYQLRKFAKRNKALVGGIGATMFVLALGTTVSTFMAVREGL